MKRLLIILCALAISACNSNEVKTNQNISNHYMDAERAYAKKDYKTARKHFEIVILSYSNNVEALFKLGNISMREHQYDKAMQYYTTVIKLKPTYAKAHHNLAMLHLFLAKNHLSFYIANNKSFENKRMANLINAIENYSTSKNEEITALDKLAEIVNKVN